MAERLTQQQREQIQALVQRLYALSGERTWFAFAHRAGVSEFSLAEWRRGQTGPSAYNLLKLLSAVSVLGDGFELPGEDARTRPLSEQTTTELRSRLAEIVAELGHRAEAGEASRHEQQARTRGGRRQRAAAGRLSS